MKADIRNNNAFHFQTPKRPLVQRLSILHKLGQNTVLTACGYSNKITN